ncbi:uncharacterized protein B0H18DRAFT_961088 [Fomitopsis serialis]|uniref:uncharacterized protein n=1 Tax=Fomitopsis serialis TaxID=139415 RepID=UPI0020088F91|nr:uncharacterized protein B0H18DRAFT_961088 [Neoantrodia serialis]KAH9912422.1 hypothetical protein B0H18DRAFT_961088 [Neoantrodia serialis]
MCTVIIDGVKPLQPFIPWSLRATVYAHEPKLGKYSTEHVKHTCIGAGSMELRRMGPTHLSSYCGSHTHTIYNLTLRRPVVEGCKRGTKCTEDVEVKHVGLLAWDLIRAHSRDPKWKSTQQHLFWVGTATVTWAVHKGQLPFWVVSGAPAAVITVPSYMKVDCNFWDLSSGDSGLRLSARLGTARSLNLRSDPVNLAGRQARHAVWRCNRAEFPDGCTSERHTGAKRRTLCLCTPVFLPSSPDFRTSVMPQQDQPVLPKGFPGELEYSEGKWIYTSAAYPFGIPASIILDVPGEWVPVANCPESAPLLFKVNEHLRNPSSGDANTMCYLTLINNSERAAAVTTARKLPDWDLPHVLEDNTRDKGWHVLRPCDSLFALPVYIVLPAGPGWDDDILRQQIFAQRDMPLELQERYLSLRSEIIGPVDQCSREAPVKEDRGWVKGTKFECLVLNKGLRGTADRKCIYAITQSQQAQNGVLSPNVEAKSFVGGDGKDAKIRRELAKVGGELGVHVIHTVQPELHHRMELQAKLLGYFRPGSVDNVCFGGSQLNISTPDYLTELQKGPMNLSESLGFFGGLHQDQHDSIGAMSVMTVFSKLHAGIHPGLFLFPESYTYVRLPDGFAEDETERSSLLTVLFSGLHWHMGMSPYVTDPSVEIAEDALRLNHIMYPMSRVMDGQSMLALGALARDVLKVPPEMYNPMYDRDFKTDTNKLNYAVDGLNIGDRRTVASFLADVGPSLDPDAFFKAFSAVDEEGQPITFSDTELVPVLEHRPDEPEYVHPSIDERSAQHIVALRHELEIPDPVPVTCPGRSKAHMKSSKSGQKTAQAKGSAKPKKTKGKKCAHDEEDGADADSRPAQRVHLDLGNEDALQVIGRPRCSARVMALAGPAAGQASGSAEPAQRGGGRTLRPCRATRHVSDGEDDQAQPSVALDDLMGPPAASLQGVDDEDMFFFKVDESVAESDAAGPSGSTSANPYAAVLSLFTEGKFHAMNKSLGNVARVLNVQQPDLASVPCKMLDRLFDAMEGEDSAAACSVEFAVLLQSASPSNWSAQTQFKHADWVQHLKCAILWSEVMLMNYYAWLWLDRVAVNYCNKVLEGDSDTDDWLARLARAVDKGFQSYNSMKLQCEDFLPSLPPRSATIPQTRYQLPDLRRGASITFIHATLHTWLDFPTKTASYLHSLFIRAIISAFRTSDVLLLDGIWDIYLRVEASLLLPHEHHRLVSSNRLDVFYYDLCQLPVLSQPMLPNVHAFAEFLRLRAGVIPAPSTPSSSAPPAPTIPLQLTNSDTHGLDALLGFVMDCYGVLPHLLEGAKLTKSPSVLQCWCAQNDDKCLPFRELARGRRAVTSPSGPFHPDNIGKVGTIASGILHCCITFGAKASYLSPNFFPSLEDFKKLVAAHPEDYLCDKSCYGTHQPHWSLKVQSSPVF